MSKTNLTEVDKGSPKTLEEAISVFVADAHAYRVESIKTEIVKYLAQKFSTAFVRIDLETLSEGNAEERRLADLWKAITGKEYGK